MATAIEKKVHIMFALMERLAQGEELYAQNEVLQEHYFNKQNEAAERSLRRYLQEIHECYSHIVVTQKVCQERLGRSVTVYRVLDKRKDVATVLRYFMEHSSDLSWLLQLVHENDPTVMESLNNTSDLQKSLKADASVFLFKTNPFETLENPKLQHCFNQLKTAVKHREYRNITYYYDFQEELLCNMKCLKLVYMSNNWYLAVENEAADLRLLRLSFIQSVAYAATKNSYQKQVLEKYRTFFKTLQNPMTLNSTFQTAQLRASPNVARYFTEHMKPFFPSQKFTCKNQDGSIDFTVNFTQPMEILPFVKQWQPDITVMSPQHLREALHADLKKALEHHEENQ